MLPHPHGGRTISLSERQLVALREKNKTLEDKLQELLGYARENDELQFKVQQFTCALFNITNPEEMQDRIMLELQERFAIPHITMRMWGNSSTREDLPDFSAGAEGTDEMELAINSILPSLAPPSAEVQAFADQNVIPVCTHHALHDTQAWFGEAGELLRAFAYLPLRDDDWTGTGKSIGLLILASEDEQRFYPEMGTVFLQRVAEIVSAAFKPYL
jgi:uncharacterized protein YigA (DUF484 family)